MTKNKIFTALMIAAAVMAGVTACGGSADTTEETTVQAATETQESQTQQTEAAASESVNGQEENGEKQEEETVSKVTLTDGGSLDESGKFVASSGKYEITPPADWRLDEGSDEEFTTFFSSDELDMLEINYETGEAADDMNEQYPDTAQEYQSQISRGEAMEIVKYEIQNEEDGSQTFRYAIRYPDAEDGLKYLAVSGVYRAAAHEYIGATVTIESDDSQGEAKAEAALDSLVIK